MLPYICCVNSVAIAEIQTVLLAGRGGGGTMGEQGVLAEPAAGSIIRPHLSYGGGGSFYIWVSVVGIVKQVFFCCFREYPHRPTENTAVSERAIASRQKT
jgi:hypothetical protein